MTDNFQIGDMVSYVSGSEFPAGTLGVVIETDNKMDPEHRGVLVYFQRPSRFGYYQTIVHKNYLTKEDK